MKNTIKNTIKSYKLVSSHNGILKNVLLSSPLLILWHPKIMHKNELSWQRLQDLKVYVEVNLFFLKWFVVIVWELLFYIQTLFRQLSHGFSGHYTFNKSKFVTDDAFVPPAWTSQNKRGKFKLRYRPRMYFFVTFIFLFDSSRGIHSTLDSAWNSTSACRQARQLLQLSKRQTRVCRSSADAMTQVARAATAVTTTCQKLLEDRRWNCSSVLLAPHFTPDLTTGKFIIR